MALDLDGAQVFRSIAERPRAFPDIVVDLNKAARTLVAKQLKAKSMNLALLRDVRGALGGEAFSHIVDGMSDAEVKSLLGKFDKNHPELKQATPDWRRRQLAALAAGSVEPSEKAKALPKARAPRKASKRSTEEPERLSSKAMAAVRKR